MNFQDRLPWSRLTTVGNSPIARATILIPVIGWFILFNDFVVCAFKRSEQVCTADISPRLLSLYLGLFIFSIGAMVYAWRCPETIKRYPTAAAYSTAEFHHISISERNDIIWQLENDPTMRNPLVALRQEVGLEDEQRRVSAVTLFNQGRADSPTHTAVSNYINGILELKFRSDNRNEGGWRIAAGGFYLLGGAVLAARAVCDLGHVLWLIARPWVR